MTRNPRFWTLAFLTATVTLGCQSESPPPQAEVKATPASEGFLLAQEPAGAKGVLDLRKEIRAHEERPEVVVVGRIGGSRKPFTAGRAAFTIVDPSFVPCNEKDDDTCPTPWDYCCDSSDDIAQGSVLVKFVDDQGKTLARDAKQELGFKELQTVVVQGRPQFDAEGNLTAVVAAGIFVRPAKVNK